MKKQVEPVIVKALVAYGYSEEEANELIAIVRGDKNGNVKITEINDQCYIEVSGKMIEPCII